MYPSLRRYVGQGKTHCVWPILQIQSVYPDNNLMKTNTNGHLARERRACRCNKKQVVWGIGKGWMNSYNWLKTAWVLCAGFYVLTCRCHFLCLLPLSHWVQPPVPHSINTPAQQMVLPRHSNIRNYFRGIYSIWKTSQISITIAFYVLVVGNQISCNLIVVYRQWCLWKKIQISRMLIFCTLPYSLFYLLCKISETKRRETLLLLCYTPENKER